MRVGSGDRDVRQVRHHATVPLLDPPGHQVHRRVAEEARDKGVRGISIHFQRPSDLHHSALIHDADAIAHGHRLDLIVGHVDRRGPDLLLLLDELVARADAQRGVEVRQRLVEQEYLGIADDRAADRDALPLPAGKRVRLALQELGQLELAGRGVHAARDFGLVDVAPAQSERQIVVHGHVRIERVRLEHHRDVARLGGHVIDDLSVDRHGAGRDRLQPGDHPQHRRLAAARRAEQHHELAVRDGEVDVVHGRRGSARVPLGQPIDRYDRHVCIPERLEPAR